MHIAAFIEALGGTTAVAVATGVPVSTVQSWKSAGRVPPWRQPALDKLAAAKGITARISAGGEPAPEPQAVEALEAPDAPTVAPFPVRTILCAVCDKRLDDRTVRGCQWQDCPQSERWAA